MPENESHLIKCNARSARVLAIPSDRDADDPLARGTHETVEFKPGKNTILNPEQVAFAQQSKLFKAWIESGDLVDLTAQGVATVDDADPEGGEGGEGGEGNDVEVSPELAEASTPEIAHAIAEKGMSLQDVATADDDTLTQFEGVGPAVAERLRTAAGLAITAGGGGTGGGE